MAVIPKPLQVKNGEGFYTLNSESRIGIQPANQELNKIGTILSTVLSKSAGREIPVQSTTDAAILLTMNPNEKELGEEGYRLAISPTAIHLTAKTPQGLFYAVQTLRCLCPLQPENGSVRIPCVQIEDKPQYAWRGILLDCVRHFMSKEFIKRYIDLIAFHKLNVLHLHLTDDQGWRIESKKYPKLTSIGAYRNEGDTRYGGYYTQEDIAEIVKYAQSQYVSIVPEFDIPGHATAAIASYPELSCEGKSIPVQTEWGIFEDVFCPGKETTFKFFEGVLDEIIAMFPSPFIHIGGDEAPRTRWEQCPHCQQRIKEENLRNEHELQSYIIRRIEKYLASRGRRLIGWDEILQGGGLPSSAIIQSWQGMEGAITASKAGHDAICSPLQFVYFDYPQTEAQVPSKPDWMKLTTLEKVYSFDPVPQEITPEESQRILGAECTMWSEHAPQEKVDQQLFPRLCAFSEVIWSPPNAQDWTDFTKRMQTHYQRLENMGVDYYGRNGKE